METIVKKIQELYAALVVAIKTVDERGLVLKGMQDENRALLAKFSDKTEELTAREKKVSVIEDLVDYKVKADASYKEACAEREQLATEREGFSVYSTQINKELADRTVSIESTEKFIAEKTEELRVALEKLEEDKKNYKKQAIEEMVKKAEK